MAPGNRLQLGLAVPIFANPGVGDFRTPNLESLDWNEVQAAVTEAEDLGFDSFWVADHMFLGRDGAIMEGWTTLAYLAGLTSRMRFGSIHLGNGFRPAPLTAKMLATLDVMSGGRLELFIDPGWRAREHLAYGFPWEPSREIRVAQVTEALNLMHAMWSGQPTTHHGRFYDVDGAICAPVPTKPSGPRVWIGEAFDESTLELIVKYADVWNSMPAGIAVLADKIDRVDAACRAAGRDPASLSKTLETQVLIYEDESELQRLLVHFDQLALRYPAGDAMSDVMSFVKQTNPNLDGGSEGVERYLDEFVIGKPDEVASKLDAYSDLGIDEVICWFMDFPERTSMNLMMSAVQPKLGAGNASN